VEELINYISDRDMLFVVAHHDDEVFVFGALLLMCIKHAKSVTVSVMSNLRPDKFNTMCSSLNITGITHDFKKFGKGSDYYVEDIFEISKTIKEDIEKVKPNIVVCHSNRIDGSHFHPYHIICSLATKHAVNKELPIVVRSDIGSKYILRPTKRSRRLLDWYLGDGKNKWRNAVEYPQHYDILGAT